MWQRIKNLWALSKYQPRGLGEFTPKEGLPVTVLLEPQVSKKARAVFIPRVKRDPVKELTQEPNVN